MIPVRFAVEYPERCLRLLNQLEPSARQHELVGSLSILIASSAILIPYERMRSRHPMHHKGRDTDLSKALKSLEKREFFCKAQFWNDSSPGDWRFSRIMTDPYDTYGWRDEAGKHPLALDAKNTIDERKAGDVLRVVRNAIAHGNIVYLNDNGIEQAGTKVEFLAFLSRYEENEDSRTFPETYRVVVTTEENFLRFVKQWTTWIATFRDDVGMFRAA